MVKPQETKAELRGRKPKSKTVLQIPRRQPVGSVKMSYPKLQLFVHYRKLNGLVGYREKEMNTISPSFRWPENSSMKY
jgi:hypothetical protein